MPGQRKRKRRRLDGHPSTAAAQSPDAGNWEVVFETQDEAEWRAYIRNPRAEGGTDDHSVLRVNILCGRLILPTTYRLSRFVPNTRPGSAESGPASAPP